MANLQSLVCRRVIVETRRGGGVISAAFTVNLLRHPLIMEEARVLIPKMNGRMVFTPSNPGSVTEEQGR